MSDNWQAPDLNEDQLKRLSEIISELEELLPAPKPFTSDEEINGLTEERAGEVRIAVRRALVFQLLHQERHWHELDDCGDYLIAATENWSALYGNLFTNDFQNVVEETKLFLTDFEKYPIGGCDGEIRYDLYAGELGEGTDPDATPKAGIALRIAQHLGYD